MASGPDIDLGTLAPHTVKLNGPTDFAGFRVACRELWATQVAPSQVDWITGDEAEGDLFAGAGRKASYDSHDSELPSLRIPPRFMPILEQAALHREPQRYALLYRIVWRLQTEVGLRDDALDADTVRARQMAQAVRRDKHKMKAFVRFRTVDEDAREGPLPPPPPDADPPADFDYDTGPGMLDSGSGPLDAEDTGEVSVAAEAADPRLHVAWFEPDHHVVEAVAPFFARRFANIRWAILTPDRSVEWDGEVLLFGPGARREQAPPPDAGEALWLTYYQNIFNPARLKLSLMKREMPVRYWRNLPEARLIGSLASQANERSANMVDREPGEPSKRRPVRPAPAATTTAKATTRPGTAASGSDAVVDEEAAFEGDAPTSLPSLARSLDRCRQCPIGELATQAVPGEGVRKARLMFVGEQPGDVEDLKGRPFVGPAGQLFDRALAQLGIDRGDTWVTNAVKHFKFELRGKRRIHKTPAQQEAAACLHWLESEIDLVDPDAIVALGATAARQLMGVHVAVTRQRGQWLRRSDGRRVLVTLHPSALLRMEPEDKEQAWTAWLADLQRAADHLLRQDSRTAH